MPNANRHTVGIMARVAEYEGLRISARTKAAITATKLHGTKLGADRGGGPRQGYSGARASTRAADVALTITELQAAGNVTAGHRRQPHRSRHPDSAWRWRMDRSAGAARS
jgi:hypothetical protein